MSDLDHYLTDELMEKAAKAEWQHEWPDLPWGGIPHDVQDHYREASHAGLTDVLPGIIRQAKAEALRELRDDLAEPRRVWCGDLGVRIALDLDDPRTHIPLIAYLDLRADRIEQGGQP